jgi:alpha-1,2-mannosyltransferase
VPITGNPANRSWLGWLRAHRALLAVIAVAELAAMIMVTAIDPHVHIDGEVYRLGTRAWLTGHDLYHNLPATISGLKLPFIYPPFAAILFSPLGLLSRLQAIAVLMACTHVTLLVTLYLVLGNSGLLADPKTGRPRREQVLLATAALLPLCTILEPVLETITYAQINVVLMVLVAVDCLWRINGPRKLPYPRGLLIGVAAGIKLTPAVFILFLLLRKDFRALVVSVATFAATVLIGFVLAPMDSREYWLTQVFSTSNVSFGSQFPGNASIYAGNQSFRALLSRFQIPEPWQTAVLGVLILAALALSVAGMTHALRQRNAPLAMAINGVLGLLASPISWSHHWVWAAPALVLLLGEGLRHRDWALLGGAGMAAGFFYIGPQWQVPQGNGAELHWNIFTQFVGNAYVYLGTAFLVYTATRWWVDRRQPRLVTPNRSSESVPAPQTV